MKLQLPLLDRPWPCSAPPGDIGMVSVRARHLPSAPGLHSRLRLRLQLPSYLQGGQIPNQGDPPDAPPQTKKARKTTKTPPPTSPRTLNQVAVFDVVAEVANVPAVLLLAVLHKLDCHLVWCVDGTAERTWERL